MIIDGIGLVLVKTNDLTGFKIYRQSIRRHSHKSESVIYKGVDRVISFARPALGDPIKRLYFQGALASLDNTVLEGSTCEEVHEALKDVFCALVFGSHSNIVTVKNIVL